MAEINDFIQFINDNWNKKLTVYKSSDLPNYIENQPINPNTANNGNPLYGLPSDLFFDVASNTIYYRTNNATTPWYKFGDIYTPSVALNIAIGKQIGHLAKTVTANDLAGLSFSEVLDKILFKEYIPTLKTPTYNFAIKNVNTNATIENGSIFEVGETLNISIIVSGMTYGSWYIEELDLDISQYATSLQSNPYTYYLNGNTISLPYSLAVDIGEKVFNVKIGYKGINAKVTNFGTTLQPANSSYLFNTIDSAKEQKIYGAYYLFAACSNSISILSANPRSFIGNGLTALYVEPVIAKVEAGSKYFVAYLQGDRTADSSYRLMLVTEEGKAVEELKFNQIPELVQVQLPDGSSTTYTKHAFKFIHALEYPLHFKLEIL